MRKIPAVFIFITLITVSLRAQIFDPGSGLTVLKTKYFDIIYSDNSKSAAYELAGFADAMFERVTNLLPTLDRQRITVVVTSDYFDANGFSRTVPYNHILLYAYPPEFESSIGNYRAWLEDLFIHELTHAVSLNIRSPFFQGLSYLFGPWLQTQIYMTPWFMVEGVTVSFESLDGFGRVNNPYVHASLMQDFIDGKFKDTAQASGPYDIYPAGQVPYFYGGMFSSYIQKKYGMEKYAQLWRTTGNGNFFALLPGSFLEVYGVWIYDEWENFKAEFAPKEKIIVNSNKLLPLSGGLYCFTLAGNKIYYVDYFLQLLREYDTSNGKIRDIFGIYNDIVSLNASPDGRLLVLNRMKYINGIPKLFAEFYDTAKNTVLDVKYPGIREASFFRTPGGSDTDVAAIRILDRYTDLVLIRNGVTAILLSGDADTYYGHPVQWDENRIVFILNEKGKKSLAVFDLRDGGISIIDAPGIETGFIHDMSVQNGKLYFSAGKMGSLYRAGWTDLETMAIQTNQYSGGIYYPMPVGGALYYGASFSDGAQLMRCPLAEIPVYTAQVNMTKFTPAPPSQPEGPQTEFKTEPYYPIGYLIPHVWAPAFDINAKGELDAVGVLSFLADPVRNNQSVTPTLMINIVKPFADFSIDWDNTALPVNFTLSLRDWLNYSRYYDEYYRQTSASLSLWWVYQFTPACNTLALGGYVSHTSIAWDNLIDRSPYNWSFTQDVTTATVYAQVSTLAPLYGFFQYRGWTAAVFADYNFQRNIAKTEFSLKIAPHFLSILINLYGAYSGTALFNTSSVNSVFWGNHYPAFYEYQSYTRFRNYYLCGNLSFPVFNWEMQWGPGLIPVYFKRFYLVTGYRAAWIEPEYLQSVFARVSLETALFANLNLNGYFEVYYAVNNNQFDYRWGIGFDFWFMGLDRPGKVKTGPGML
jgi:hypothetical protein